MRIKIPLKAVGLGTVTLIVTAMAGARIQASSAQGVLFPTPTPQPGAAASPWVALGPVPSPLPVTDLAPSLSTRAKAVVYVQRPDGTKEEFLVLPQKVQNFINSIPGGDTLIAASLPEDVVDQHPAPGSSPLGTVRYTRTEPTPTPLPTTTR